MSEERLSTGASNGKPLVHLTQEQAFGVFSLVEHQLLPVLTFSNLCDAAPDGVLCDVGYVLKLALSKFQADLQASLNRMVQGDAS